MPLIRSACNKILSAISIKAILLARVNFTIHTHRLLCNRMCVIPFSTDFVYHSIVFAPFFLSFLSLALALTLLVSFGTFEFKQLRHFFLPTHLLSTCPFALDAIGCHIIISEFYSECVCVCTSHINNTQKRILLADQLSGCHKPLSCTHFSIVCSLICQHTTAQVNIVEWASNLCL